jgi:hypothetical protein
MGKLIYDNGLRQLVIISDNVLDELRGGDVIEVKAGADDEWTRTRVEYSRTKKDWYLTGLYNAGEVPNGLMVRRH